MSIPHMSIDFQNGGTRGRYLWLDGQLVSVSEVESETKKKQTNVLEVESETKKKQTNVSEVESKQTNVLEVDSTTKNKQPNVSEVVDERQQMRDDQRKWANERAFDIYHGEDLKCSGKCLRRRMKCHPRCKLICFDPLSGVMLTQCFWRRKIVSHLHVCAPT